MRPTNLLALCIALTVAAIGCSNGSLSGPDRAVTITTTACGHASKTTGAGVVAEDGWVIASAHVVSGAGSITISGAFGQRVGDVVVVDTEADLALLHVPGLAASPVELAGVTSGAVVELAGGGPTTSVSASIIRPVEVRIEAVRSTERISRHGYEIDIRVERGDSGGGVFDTEDRLVGVVFGRPLEDVPRSFVVNHAAIEDLLSADRSGSWSCDPDQHQITSDRQ